jgi:hypothetical protein
LFSSNNNSNLRVLYGGDFSHILPLQLSKYSRSRMRDLDLNINRIKKFYLIAHLTQADLSMLKDFDDFKEQLTIVNKCFVTLGKPIDHEGYLIHIRDTSLLAPAGKKDLSSLGDLLGVHKLDLSPSELKSMDMLLLNNREKFINYAITDAVITLLYANFMEDELFKCRVFGIPLTLSSLSTANVLNE